MRIDTTLLDKDIIASGEKAAAAEVAGHDAAWCTETGLDVFLQAYEVSRRTETIGVGTAIAVALARTPMTVAYSAWNIAGVADGRFTLGLGSQVKAHVERRYSMPWQSPVGQMREFVLALRAIWDSWSTGERLDFQGEYYTHTLMDPFWAPKPHAHRIPIYLAAVGPKMVEMAAEVADGILLHSFVNPAYLEQVTWPAIQRGLEKSGRTLDDLDISLPMFMAIGDTEEEQAKQREQIAAQVGFYASTPAYRPVLEAIGHGDLQPELTALSKSKEWDRMAQVVPEDFIDHFSVTGRPEDVPGLVKNHLGDKVQRTSSYYGWPVDDPARLSSIFEAFRQEK